MADLPRDASAVDDAGHELAHDLAEELAGDVAADAVSDSAAETTPGGTSSSVLRSSAVMGVGTVVSRFGGG